MEYAPEVTNINFECELFKTHWNADTIRSPVNPKLVDFMNILAICHTIIIDNKNGQIQYNASSPDELALTNAARHFNVVFMDRGASNNIVVRNTILQESYEYELLNVIEFTSFRKRMSVVVKTPEGKILVMTKGADSIIIARLAKG
jgi:phospholipid-translocating ATPase